MRREVGRCEWCHGPLVASRVDARTCSKSCRQAKARATVRPSELSATDWPLRLAYADPPYPGMSALYRDRPDYAGEVDLDELLDTLSTYDGWALSTSSRALPSLLAMCSRRALCRNVRVAAWVRPGRPHSTAAVVKGWEPVVWIPARHIVPAGTHGVRDALLDVRPRRRPTLPGNVIGAKSPAFCAWVFALLGARPGDELDDLYPGSGIVARSWAAWSGAAIATRHVLSPGEETSHLEDATDGRTPWWPSSAQSAALRSALAPSSARAAGTS